MEGPFFSEKKKGAQNSLYLKLPDARAIGCDCEIGSIEEGKYADFIVCDRNLNIRQVYIGGQPFSV